MSRKFVRVMVASDFHCGHKVGLCHPDFNPVFRKRDDREYFLSRSRALRWKDFKRELDALKPIDILIANGDLVDGKGTKSGGTELLTTDRGEQADMAAAIIQEIGAQEVYMSYGCLTPGHRILTADLRWTPVEDLVIGDRLVGFNEHPPSTRNRRRFFTTTVTANEPSLAPVYRLYFSDGTMIEASEEHPFLLRRGSKYDWCTVKQLYKWLYYQQGDKTHRPNKNGQRNQRSPVRFPRFAPTWDGLDSYAAGYLAGFFDSDGSLSQRKKEMRTGWAEHIFRLHGYQNPGVVLNTVCEYLDELGVPHNLGQHQKNSENVIVDILGGRWEAMRLLGRIRPVRLLANFDVNVLGTIRKPYDSNLLLVKMEPIGEREVCGLGTDSGTYIGEGFLCHNTPYHTGLEEDWEKEVASKVNAVKIGGHDWLDVRNVVFDYRHFVSRSSIPHGRYTPLAREKLWSTLWAEYGEYPTGDILIRSHVHYFAFCGGFGWKAYITPALQTAGSKYGSRVMGGTVDWGFLAFDVYGKGECECHERIVKFRTAKQHVMKALQTAT